MITKCIREADSEAGRQSQCPSQLRQSESRYESVRQIIQANLNPTAMEFIERKVIQLGEDYLKMSFPEPEASAYVLTTLMAAKMKSMSIWLVLRKLQKRAVPFPFFLWRIKRRQPEYGRSAVCW